MADGADPLENAARLFDLTELPVASDAACFSVAVPGAALTGLPGFPVAALPQSGRLAAGRGTDTHACRRSCLGEAVELVSACFWGDEQLIRLPDRDIGPAALDPGTLNGLTRGQVRSRASWNARHGDFDWRAPPRRRGGVVERFRVADAFGGADAWAPADFVFLGRRRPGDEDAVSIADSNGCAAAATAGDAVLAAILELVERDATGRWWYGRRSRPPVDLSRLDRAAALIARLGSRARAVHLFDISSDIAIPVLAAASAEPDGRDVALGFAARLDVDCGAVSALTEMLQMELALAVARRFGAAGGWDDWRRAVSLRTPPLDGAYRGVVVPPAGVRRTAADPDLSAALRACAAAGVDLWLADLTRPVIGPPVFRALSTTLCHYKPRFARARLLAPDPFAANALPAAARGPYLTI